MHISLWWWPDKFPIWRLVAQGHNFPALRLSNNSEASRWNNLCHSPSYAVRSSTQSCWKQVRGTVLPALCASVSRRCCAGPIWEGLQHEPDLLPENYQKTLMRHESACDAALLGLAVHKACEAFLPGGSITQLRTTELSWAQQWFSVGDPTMLKNKKMVEWCLALKRVRTSELNR